MPEAFIYDHVRTPRGRGKPDGALHEVTALALATAPLRALRERNNLAEDVVDDVVLGVVDPVGEAAARRNGRSLRSHFGFHMLGRAAKGTWHSADEYQDRPAEPARGV